MADKQIAVTEAYKLVHTLSQTGGVKLSEFEFVPTDVFGWWLQEWPNVVTKVEDWTLMGVVGNFKPKPTVDMESFLCPHGRLGQNQLTHVKCVPESLVSSEYIIFVVFS